MEANSIVTGVTRISPQPASLVCEMLISWTITAVDTVSYLRISNNYANT